MILDKTYIVAKYYNDIDTVITAVNNEKLATGSNIVYKDFSYTNPSGNLSKIDKFYKAEIQYDSINKIIVINEYMTDGENYQLIGTVSIQESEYNSIKTTI